MRIDLRSFRYRGCHRLRNLQKLKPRRYWLSATRLKPLPYPALLFFVVGLHLLRRSLHNVVTHRTLHAVLIGIVVNHRMLTAKIVERRRRRRAPLQRSALPRIIWRRLAPEPAVNQVVEKNQLRHTRNESSNGDPSMHRDPRLQEVIRERRVAADIPGHSQVMEWHEDAIRAREAEPEMNFSQGLIHHSSGHLGEPEVSCREDAKHSRDAHHHVEMADHEVSRVEHDIDRRLSQEEATHTAADEHRNKAQRKQGRRVDTEPGTIQTEDPDQYDDGGRDGYDQGGEGECQRGEWIHSADEHVMAVDHVAE